MASNEVFKVTLDKYQNIKQNITNNFKIQPKQVTSESIVESFEIRSKRGKITFTFYKTNKLMIQSSISNQDFVDIIKKISYILSITENKKSNIVSHIEQDELEFDYHIGCDEAGKGETFGSLFLGCALIQKENLKSIQDIIKNKNIRKLTENNIERIRNKLQNQYIFSYKKYSASEIDKNSLTILLDKGYKHLLSNIIGNKTNLIIAIDDYGIGDELKNYIKKIENNNIKIIVKHKADEEYTTCKIASLGARFLRINEIEELNKRFVLVEESTGEKIYPRSGTSSNKITERYLKLFRKQNPNLEFPSFVRMKWKNVKKINNKYQRN